MKSAASMAIPTDAWILTDIEGTTSSITFVRDILFPHARSALPGFIREHGRTPRVRELLNQIANELGQTPDDDAIIHALQHWIDQDRKHTALKALQGMIWEAGYRDGQFTAPLYPDVAPCLRAWRARGIELGVYSSGSVSAQKLLFSHTEQGDLSGLFGAWFDTEIGHKRNPGSYRTIAGRLCQEPAALWFLSDTVEELDAAREAGLHTILLDRRQDYPQPRISDDARHGHTRAESFSQIRVAGDII